MKSIGSRLGMPRFSDVLSPCDVAELPGYLIDQSWEAYSAQEPQKPGDSVERIGGGETLARLPRRGGQRGGALDL